MYSEQFLSQSFCSSDRIVPSDETLLYEILEEALLRTFKDIDSEFSQVHPALSCLWNAILVY